MCSHSWCGHQDIMGKNLFFSIIFLRLWLHISVCIYIPCSSDLSWNLKSLAAYPDFPFQVSKRRGNKCVKTAFSRGRRKEKQMMYVLEKSGWEWKHCMLWLQAHWAHKTDSLALVFPFPPGWQSVFLVWNSSRTIAVLHLYVTNETRCLFKGSSGSRMNTGS